MNVEKIRNYNCPVEAAMDVIGGKYKAQIVYELIGGARRCTAGNAKNAQQAAEGAGRGRRH